MRETSYQIEREFNSPIRPASGQIQARYFRGFPNFVRRLGADYRPLLERFAVDPDIFGDPDSSLQCSDMANMLEYCSSFFDDPLFGAHFAEYQDPDILGSAMALARSAPNFGTGLQMLMDYLPLLHSPEGGLHIDKAERVFELRWNTSADLNQITQPKVHGFLMTMKTLQALTGKPLRPLHVGMSHDLGRAGVTLLQDKIGCRIERATESFAVFSLDLLEEAVPTSNQTVFNLLSGAFAHIRKDPVIGLENQIRGYLKSAIPAGQTTIEQCANRINLTVRTLQKRLAREGTHFSLILEQEIIELAKAMLDRSADPLLDIALELGYSDQTCFGRAFKRLTGLTPGAYRNRAL